MKEAFNNSEDFKDILVKEIYEENPPIHYPMITVEEINNSENLQFTDNMGEHISDLGYQINCHSRNTSKLQAQEAARTIGFAVNDVFMNKYKMRRIGQPVLLPLNTDKTVMVYTLRYECAFDLDEDRIYKN